MRKKLVTVAALAAAIMSTTMNIYAMEVHINSVEDEGDFQLVDDSMDINGVMPGDEMRDAITIYNDTDAVVHISMQSESVTCTKDSTGAELPMDFNDEIYVGYRDSVSEEDVNGIYWGKDRLVGCGPEGDVQAHIDSGLWLTLSEYLEDLMIKPGEHVDIGRVVSLDGPKIDNRYMSSTITYEASAKWYKEVSDEPTSDDPITPEPASPVDPPADSPVSTVPPVETTVVDTQPTVDAVYVRTTGYTGTQGYVGKTASGTVVHEGTLAGPKEWLGRECYLIDTNGNVIGEYTFEDTGNPKYVNDTRIDIWFPSNAELNEYQKTVGDYALIIFK